MRYLSDKAFNVAAMAPKRDLKWTEFPSPCHPAPTSSTSFSVEATGRFTIIFVYKGYWTSCPAQDYSDSQYGSVTC